MKNVLFELKPNATWFVCQLKLTNSFGSLVRNTFIDVNWAVFSEALEQMKSRPLQVPYANKALKMVSLLFHVRVQSNPIKENSWELR